MYLCLYACISECSMQVELCGRARNQISIIYNYSNQFVRFMSKLHSVVYEAIYMEHVDLYSPTVGSCSIV